MLYPKATKKSHEKNVQIVWLRKPHLLDQWFQNVSGARTTKNILELRKAQNIDSYWYSQISRASLATSGITGLDKSDLKIPQSSCAFLTLLCHTEDA
jgi:hypothetical protein